MKTHLFVSLLVALLLSTNARAQQYDFFWSTHDLNSGASNGDIEPGCFFLGDTVSLFLYYSTINSELDTGAGLDITLSNDGFARFVSAETFNFDIALTADTDVVLGTRWDVFGPAQDVQDDAITGLNAFTIGGDGIIDANNGSGPFLDLGYDQSANAFLFARIDVEILSSFGGTDIEVSAGDIGIVHNGQTVKPKFGRATLTGCI